MDISEATINKIKVLLNEGKESEAKEILVNEASLPDSDATVYIERLSASLKSSSSSAKPVSKFLPWTFLLLGTLCWGFTIYFYLAKTNKLANSTLITGTVVKMLANDEGLSAPVVAYSLAGKDYQYADNVYSKPSAYKVNETIEIYVNNDNPQDIMVNSFVSKWLIVIIIGSVGLIFELVGVLLMKIKPSANHSGIDLFDHDDD